VIYINKKKYLLVCMFISVVWLSYSSFGTRLILLSLACGPAVGNFTDSIRMAPQGRHRHLLCMAVDAAFRTASVNILINTD
jgi:hypothetical protein